MERGSVRGYDRLASSGGASTSGVPPLAPLRPRRLLTDEFPQLADAARGGPPRGLSLRGGHYTPLGTPSPPATFRAPPEPAARASGEGEAPSSRASSRASSSRGSSSRSSRSGSAGRPVRLPAAAASATAVVPRKLLARTWNAGAPSLAPVTDASSGRIYHLSRNWTQRSGAPAPPAGEVSGCSVPRALLPTAFVSLLPPRCRCSLCGDVLLEDAVEQPTDDGAAESACRGCFAGSASALAAAALDAAAPVPLAEAVREAIQAALVLCRHGWLAVRVSAAAGKGAAPVAVLRLDAFGCREAVPLKDRAAHEASCPLRLVRCTLPELRDGTAAAPTAVPPPGRRCGHICRAAGMVNHRAACDFREVPCPHAGCSEQPLANALAVHLPLCPQRTATCTNRFASGQRQAVCDWTGTVEGLEAHLAECEHEVIACALPDVRGEENPTRADFASEAGIEWRPDAPTGAFAPLPAQESLWGGTALPGEPCAFRCRRGDMVAHREACGYRTAACAICAKLVSTRLMGLHEARCAARMGRCSRCYARVHHTQRAAHAAGGCTAERIPCEFAVYGCGEASLTRAEYGRHMQAAGAAHLRLLLLGPRVGLSALAAAHTRAKLDLGRAEAVAEEARVELSARVQACLARAEAEQARADALADGSRTRLLAAQAHAAQREAAVHAAVHAALLEVDDAAEPAAAMAAEGAHADTALPTARGGGSLLAVFREVRALEAQIDRRRAEPGSLAPVRDAFDAALAAATAACEAAAAQVDAAVAAARRAAESARDAALSAAGEAAGRLERLEIALDDGLTAEVTAAADEWLRLQQLTVRGDARAAELDAGRAQLAARLARLEAHRPVDAKQAATLRAETLRRARARLAAAREGDLPVAAAVAPTAPGPSATGPAARLGKAASFARSASARGLRSSRAASMSTARRPASAYASDGAAAGPPASSDAPATDLDTAGEDERDVDAAGLLLRRRRKNGGGSTYRAHAGLFGSLGLPTPKSARIVWTQQHQAFSRAGIND